MLHSSLFQSEICEIVIQNEVIQEACKQIVILNLRNYTELE